MNTHTGQLQIDVVQGVKDIKKGPKVLIYEHRCVAPFQPLPCSAFLIWLRKGQWVCRTVCRVIEVILLNLWCDIILLIPDQEPKPARSEGLSASSHGKQARTYLSMCWWATLSIWLHEISFAKKIIVRSLIHSGEEKQLN